MLGKYQFGYGQPIESPELDAFVADVMAVFKKYGVGVCYTQAEGDYDGGHTDASIVLCPFDDADFDWLTGDLDDYRGGVPWLDAVKKRYRDAIEQAAREHREKELIRAQQKRDEAAAAKRAQIDAALRDGIELGGKKYRLVEQ
jgi:hypothetical protein